MLRRACAVILFAVLPACGVTVVRNAPPSALATTGAVQSSFGTYWQAPIRPSARVDPRSAAIVRHLTSRPQGIVANLYAYGVPIYTAAATTRGQRVECTKPWGVCELEQQLVPVPSGARPNTGSDGAMVVVHPASGKSYEFWQAQPTSGGWRTSWGAVVPLGGPGTGGATGSGISRLAGVVRTSEVAQRSIPHALVFSTDNACARVHRAPATTTDGTSNRSDCIPEGARIQLSPDVSLGSIPGLTPGERAVATALQRYGAYVVDAGSAPAAFTFERPTTGGDPYPSAGFPWDYWHLPHIPWNRLHVLATWNGS